MDLALGENKFLYRVQNFSSQTTGIKLNLGNLSQYIYSCYLIEALLEIFQIWSREVFHMYTLCCKDVRNYFHKFSNILNKITQIKVIYFRSSRSSCRKYIHDLTENIDHFDFDYYADDLVFACWSVIWSKSIVLSSSKLNLFTIHPKLQYWNEICMQIYKHIIILQCFCRKNFIYSPHL